MRVWRVLQIAQKYNPIRSDFFFIATAHHMYTTCHHAVQCMHTITSYLKEERLEDEVVLVCRLGPVVLEVVEPLHHAGVEEGQNLDLNGRQHAGCGACPPADGTHNIRVEGVA